MACCLGVLQRYPADLPLGGLLRSGDGLVVVMVVLGPAGPGSRGGRRGALPLFWDLCWHNCLALSAELDDQGHLQCFGTIMLTDVMVLCDERANV